MRTSCDAAEEQKQHRERTHAAVPVRRARSGKQSFSEDRTAVYRTAAYCREAFARRAIRDSRRDARHARHAPSVRRLACVQLEHLALPSRSFFVAAVAMQAALCPVGVSGLESRQRPAATARQLRLGVVAGEPNHKVTISSGSSASPLRRPESVRCKTDSWPARRV